MCDVGRYGCAFLARISGHGRVRRTDVEPSQNRKMRSDLFGSSQAAQMLSTLVIIMAMGADSGAVIGRRDTRVWLLARDILADGANSRLCL